MGLEIERRFLVKSTDFLKDVTDVRRIVQGYLNTDPLRTVRVRLDGHNGYLTVKGKSTGAVRAEFEYSIPEDDATSMLKLCQHTLVTKDRFSVKHGDHIWEVDVFQHDNIGLVIAEVELDAEHEYIEIPKWVSTEITMDFSYSNSALSTNPYTWWK